MAQLAQLRAIGPKGAWVLVKELLGCRRFANRRELAGCLGLAPTPYDSCGSQVEQGISKAGNKRARALLVELAWGWLRLQPDSDADQVVQPALRRRRQAPSATINLHRAGDVVQLLRVWRGRILAFQRLAPLPRLHRGGNPIANRAE